MRSLVLTLGLLFAANSHAYTVDAITGHTAPTETSETVVPTGLVDCEVMADAHVRKNTPDAKFLQYGVSAGIEYKRFLSATKGDIIYALFNEPILVKRAIERLGADIVGTCQGANDKGKYVLTFFIRRLDPAQKAQTPGLL